MVLGRAVRPVNSARGGVGGYVGHVGDPPGAGQLQRQQRQQVADGGDVPGAGVARRLDQRGQVQGEQVRDRQQQPGQAGRTVGGQIGVVIGFQRPGPGQVLAKGTTAGGVGAAPDPGQPGLGDHLVDPGAVQRDALAG